MTEKRREKERYKRLFKLIFSAVLLLGLCAMYGVFWIGFYNKEVLQAPFYRRGNWLIIALYAILLLLFMHTYGGFKIGYLKHGNLIYSQIISVVFTNIIAYLQTAIIDKRFVIPTYMLLVTVADVVFIFAWTLTFQVIYRSMFPRKHMIFIKGDRWDYHLIDKINAREDKYEIDRIVSYKKNMRKLQRIIQKYDAVIIGDMPSHERNLLLKYCYDRGIRSYSVPKISDILLRSSDELTLFDTPLLLSRNIGLTIEQQWAKRLEDIVVALIMLVIFSPIFILAALGIKLSDGGPVFYRQERLTKDAQRFLIYKFRTMVVDAEKLSGPVLASENDPRIFPVGRLLRATRMDELPQILNILKGDMSVVGPRPERPELAAEIEQEIPEFAYRLKVKAGLTGYAQVYGKYNTTAYDKLKLDLMYIRQYSLLLDLKLIILTPKIMFLKESTEGVMPENDDLDDEREEQDDLAE